MTRDERVLNYMQEHGFITQRDAEKELANRRLSSSIFNLKKEHEIEGIFKSTTNKYDERVRYKAYFLKEDRDRALRLLR